MRVMVYRPQGFTLVELIVTLSVAAILIALAAPAFSEFVQNNRLVAQSNALVTTFNLARNEAASRTAPAIVCSSTDGATCTGSAWEQGWISGVDLNFNGVLDAAEVTQVFSALGGSITITTAPAGTTQVNYPSNGFVPLAPIFTLCDGRAGETGRTVALLTTGRPRTAEVTCP